ncbi:MAG: hypothetical protein JST39_20125 [Bacteroidetes bacterium]|nr:hypothetical protein [Bacteroidota bacterium]
MVRLIVLLCTLLPLTSRFGQDSFDIYLKGKLLTHQIVSPSQGLHALQLNEADPGDQLVIEYRQCNAPDRIGRGRSIYLKDYGGKIVRTWKFADAGSGSTAMSIPVKELLQAKKASKGTLSLCYCAAGREYGQAFASI